MPYAEIGQAPPFVGANRNVSRAVDHVVIDAFVPFQLYDWIEVAKTGDGGADAHGQRQADRRSYAKCPVDIGIGPAIQRPHAHRQLPAQDRRGEYVSWIGPHKIYIGI